MVPGIFTFDGSIQIYLDADYSDFPENQPQTFTVGVRFEGPSSSGLSWENIGSTRPGIGIELTNAYLSGALATKRRFTPEEWRSFGVEQMHASRGIGPLQRVDGGGPDAGGPWRPVLNSSYFILGGDGTYYRPIASWSWDIILEASEARPSRQSIATPSSFSGPLDGRFMNVGEAVTMRLVFARWSFVTKRA